MTADLFEFSWMVSADGYRVVEGIEGGGAGNRARYLVPVGQLGAERVRRFTPLRTYPRLFVEFAETKETEAGVLGFAERFGHLFENRALIHSADGVVAGELITRWYPFISQMRAAVELWGHLQIADSRWLKEHMKWERASVMYLDQSKYRVQEFLIATAGDGRFETMERGELIGPGWRALQMLINVGGRGVLSGELHGVGSKLSLRVSPIGLLGAMWLQFCLALERGEGFQKCQYCKSPFVIVARGARNTRRYCSTACRVSAHRKRKREASKS